MPHQGESPGREEGWPVSLVLDGAFEDEAGLRQAITRCKLCFDHDPFTVRDGSGQLVQLGFQLNLYAAFQDPRYLPHGDDTELTELVGLLRRLCRVFVRSLAVLKPCERPVPPLHRVVYAKERGYRAEVCLQIPIFAQPVEGRVPEGREGALLAAAECLLLHLGARRGAWEGHEGDGAASLSRCEERLRRLEQPER